MKNVRKNQLMSLLLLSFLVFSNSFLAFSAFNRARNSTSPSSYGNLNVQAVNRTGKVFTNITSLSNDCSISREQPNLNVQPRVYIPNYNLSYAKMYFENITAMNYTKEIEVDPTQFITSDETGPLYIYQKFSVLISQYVNNISIFIQDIVNTYNFTEENSWEVAIVNCTSDGTPNNETLGKVSNPHPLNMAAHWEHFDFLHSEQGAVFLNVSETFHTNENGVDKYWFAFRIKIPPDDRIYGGGPKFLYFNPDGGDINDIGEGETYLFYNQAWHENFTVNYVKEITGPINGSRLTGDLTSLENFDGNSYNCRSDTTNLTIDMKFDIKELSSGIIDQTVVNFFYNSPLLWAIFHTVYVNSIDFYLVTSISDTLNLNTASILIKNYSSGQWYDLSNRINIEQDTELLLSYKISEPDEKIAFLKHFVNYTNNNSMEVRFSYYGSTQFDVSYNLFTANFGERLVYNETILPYDPLVQELEFPTELNEDDLNGNVIGDVDLDALKLNDNNFFRAQADTNNLSIEFKFNILEGVDLSLWDVDLYDWGFNLGITVPPLYPYPYIPQLDFRTSSNVSITNPTDLDFAVIEIYKGKANYSFLSPEENALEWLRLTPDNRSLAFSEETTTSEVLPSLYTWVMIQLVNASDDNSIRMRFLYVGNGTFENFIVSIDEFTVNLYIQNTITSDITSKIGFGLNANNLKPSDIALHNFGTAVVNSGPRSGYWEGDIQNGAPDQGFFEFNVTSLWNFIKFDINGTYEVYKVNISIIFLDAPSNQYKLGNYPFSVRVISGDGRPLRNLNIVFQVLQGDTLVKFETVATTNNEGIATANLEFSQTGEQFSIKAIYREEGIYVNSELQSTRIRIVDDFILFMDTFMQLLPYILAILAGIFIVIGVRRHKHQKLRRVWAKEATILDDLVNISYIMIIHKDVGVSIFNKQIAMEGIDSDLISGFLQAISQFRQEFQKGTKKEQISKGFEMDYYDFKIIITDGEYARVALVLDKSPSDQLKENQTAFTNEFEYKFGFKLERFEGDITPFKETEPLIEKYFNITLMYPLKLAPYRDVFKLNSLEKSLVGIAEQIQKERKFFFVSSLLSFSIAGRKESRDEIISTILSLKNRGILIPVEI
ncbi:MAG: hypothetical protein ACFE96_05885 [Candidatus Hermodarchaeota archaeon]